MPSHSVTLGDMDDDSAGLVCPGSAKSSRSTQLSSGAEGPFTEDVNFSARSRQGLRDRGGAPGSSQTVTESGGPAAESGA